MKVRLSARAEKEFRKLGKVNQMVLLKKMRSMATEDIKEEKLKGYKHIFRVRVGDYRIVYKRTVNELFVVLIGHRKDIYKKVKQILG